MCLFPLAAHLTGCAGPTMRSCLIPQALLSLLLTVLCAGQLEDADFCTFSELRRPTLNMSCPKVPYQNVVGEAEWIIKQGSNQFNTFLSRIQSSTYLEISQSSSAVISQVLHNPLTSLTNALRRYRRNAKLQVLRAWTDQQSSDVPIPPFYEGVCVTLCRHIFLMGCSGCGLCLDSILLLLSVCGCYLLFA